MNVVKETERLLIRTFKVSDKKFLENIWGDEEVMGLCAGATAHDKLPEIIEYYVKCNEEIGLSVYAVVEKATGKLIGTAGFNVEDTIEKVELIYHFSKQCWGKGFAYEAVSACLEMATTNERVKCLYASANPTNLSSVRILEKLGFKYIGMKWFDDTNQEEPYYELDVR